MFIKRKHLLLLLVIEVWLHTAKAQTWPKIYDSIHYSWTHDLIETYDRGYLISGQVDAMAGPKWIYYYREYDSDF